MKSGSSFERTHLSLQKPHLLLLQLAYNDEMVEVSECVDICREISVIQCFKCLWDVCSWKLMQQPRCLGGTATGLNPNVCEIAESFCSHRPKVIWTLQPLQHCHNIDLVKQLHHWHAPRERIWVHLFTASTWLHGSCYIGPLLPVIQAHIWPNTISFRRMEGLTFEQLPFLSCCTPQDGEPLPPRLWPSDWSPREPYGTG